MPRRSQRAWLVLIILNVVSLCVLGFYRTTDAAPRQAPQQSANPVEQTFQVINQLKQLNALMKEQNQLLRSGKLRVVVSNGQKPQKP